MTLIVDLSNRHLSEIRCPHCGYEYSNSDEYGNGDKLSPVRTQEVVKAICDECKKPFWWIREIEYTVETDSEDEIDDETRM